MGIIKFIFLGFLPCIGGSLYMSLRLGNKLAVSCRNTGRQFGMFYNYLKILLNFLKPKAAQTGEVIQMVRSINQQSHAFTRELHSNLLNSKRNMETLMPGLKDPEIVEPKDDNAELNQARSKVNGAKILEVAIIERRSIIEKKKNDSLKSHSFYN